MQVRRRVFDGSRISHVPSDRSIRVRPSSVSSERVRCSVQKKLAAIIKAIPVSTIPAISQGEIVSQRRIDLSRVSNKVSVSVWKRRVSLAMICCAAPTMFFKSILKVLSWDEIEATCSALIVSSSAFSFSLSRVGLPVFMENLSFQPPAFAGVGVAGGDVGLAGAWQVEACFGERLDHGRPVGDQPHVDLVLYPGVQLVSTLGTGRGLGGVTDFLGAFHVHRVGPTVALIHHVPKTVVGVLVSGRRDVEALARRQFQARRAEVKLDPAFVAMADPEHLILLRVQPREGQPLEPVHDLGLLVLRRVVAVRKADHARAVGPLVAAGVDQGLGALGVAAQDLGQGVSRDGYGLAVGIADQVAVVVIGQHPLRHEITDRPRARSFAVGEELDQHLRASSRSAASWRSITTRRRATVSVSRSVRPIFMVWFSQRAI